MTAQEKIQLLGTVEDCPNGPVWKELTDELAGR